MSNLQLAQPSNCVFCGEPLTPEDIRDECGACHSCRSPRGKLGDLDIAIRATGDNPKRIAKWKIIRGLLQKRFGATPDDLTLLENLQCWLEAEHDLSPGQCLRLSIPNLIRLLKGLPTIPLAPSSADSASLKKGRPARSLELREREMEIYQEWQRRRECGESKAHFARECGYTKLKDFDRLLSRVKRQIDRANKKRGDRM